jgi:predicted GH43/DUF377 family glycosyl hydrolase
MFPRPSRFDSLLVEPGPPALLTVDGVVLIYNGAAVAHTEGGVAVGVSYQPGQALFDKLDPTSLIARAEDPFIVNADFEELEGQVGNVCFAQGLVPFNESWFLYFGMADSRIGCATAPIGRL